MSLFSDIEKMGLSGVNMDDVFKEEAKKVPQRPEVTKDVKEELKEEDVLFDKSYQCPVCDHSFKAKAVKTGKIRMINQDDELRPIYENGIDPFKYDAVTCPRCGYTALTRYYTALTNAQLRTMKRDYCANFKGISEESGCMSYDGALLRHKLALVCAMTRNAKNSEKAYIFLKMAWLFRGKAETMDIKKADDLKLVRKEELECLSKAYEGFNLAFSKESFPMCGMDEMTLRYTMAVIAYKLDKLEESARLISGVLTSKATPQRLKDKAYDLKEKIKARVSIEKNR